MRSHLLVGKVRHRRARPFTYQLEHDVWYAGLDTRELDEVARRSKLLRRNRRGILELRDADHLVPPARDVDADVRAQLRRAGDDPTDWSILLIANLRVLGYVFNPASFFLCRDADGRLRAVVVEVHNTFGDRHLYVLREGREGGREADVAGGAFTGAMDKDFFVSPFISEDGRYAVHVADDDAGLRIAIALRQDGQMTLSTSLVLERRPLTDRALVGLLIRRPLMPQRTMALIHWHALRLWRRGAPFFRHGQWVRKRRGGESPGSGAPEMLAGSPHRAPLHVAEERGR